MGSATFSLLAKMMDMSEFGEAAPFLRKSDKELMVLQTVAFEGKVLVVDSAINQEGWMMHTSIAY